MPWRHPYTAENVFLASGLLLILLGWLSDFVGIQLGQTQGGHGAGNTITRLFFTLFGLVFAAGGSVYEHYEKFLTDARYTTRYLLSNLFLLDGAIHLYAFTDHLVEIPLAAAFFAVVAPMQFAAGILLRRPDGRWDRYAFALTLFLFVAWILSRTVPVWPINEIEDIGSLDAVSKLIEVMILYIFYAIWKDRRAVRRAAARQGEVQSAFR